MMSTWAAADQIRHPWYAAASLKRRHSDSEDDDDAVDLGRGPESDFDYDVTPTVYPTPPPERVGGSERKRRRCETIERSMARLHIAPGIAGAVSLSQAASTSSEASYYTAGSTSPMPRSAMLDEYAVEEPISPLLIASRSLPLPEVRMDSAGPAWYEREKDRIVITDLDKAVKEAEEEYKSEAEPHPDAAEHADSNEDYSISAVLLDHIKRQANFPYVPREKEKKQGALVLFRPPPVDFFAPPDAGEAKAKRDVKGDDVHEDKIDMDTTNVPTASGVFENNMVQMDQMYEDAGEPMDVEL
ncbi:hypothetical protein M0805_006237 [Coniferiporia weirii]|nr:hypothetical protein M0805_006237 [Coniferiporia weirii]